MGEEEKHYWGKMDPFAEEMGYPYMLQ